MQQEAAIHRLICFFKFKFAHLMPLSVLLYEGGEWALETVKG